MRIQSVQDGFRLETVVPKLNPARTLRSEANLAARIAYERDQRGWNNEELADRMTKAGVGIQGSAIYKIEFLGRRITVDELVGFATVFGVDAANLLLPLEIAIQKASAKLLEALDIAGRELQRSIDRAYKTCVAVARAEAAANDGLLADAVRARLDKPDPFAPDEARFLAQLMVSARREIWNEASGE